jgi:hypothetical protein
MGKDAFEGSRSHIIVDIRHKIKVLVYTYIRIKKMYSKPLKGIYLGNLRPSPFSSAGSRSILGVTDIADKGFEGGGI